MAATRKAPSAQVRRLRLALERAKAKSAALAKERAEAREQQAAAAEILTVISRSPDNAQPVFDAIVKRTLRLMRGHSALVTRIAGAIAHLGAFTSTSKAGDALIRKGYPRPVDYQSATGRAVRSGRPSFVSDIEKAPGSERSKSVARKRGYRSLLSVPMLRDGTVVGTLNVTRKKAGSFSKHEIDLLKTFADQAVIATENVRLFNETKEALEHQKASADILRVISGSPTDLAPVMAAVAESAARLCDATDAHMWQREGDVMQLVASYGGLPVRRPRLQIGRQSVVGRAAADCRLVHVHDLAAVWKREFPDSTAMAEGGYRSVLAVPLIRETSAIGAILIRRKEVRPFSEKQLSLLQTFADQAVIAIENVRLFNETKEALERQTATAEILKVIASSPSDVQPVFDAIVRSCGGLFRDSGVSLWLVRGEQMEVRATNGESMGGQPIDRESALGVCILDGRTLHLPDLEEASRQMPRIRNLGLKLGFRSGIYAPLLLAGRAIGGISVLRRESGAFQDRELALLNTFADQAVIAIENVRLFNETKESLERQTAISEILRVISNSPGDVQPVLQAVAERAARICEAQFADIVLAVGDTMRVRASVGDTGRPIGEAIPLDRSTVMGRSIVDRKPVHIADLRNAGDEFPLGQRLAMRFGHRTILAVPLLREDRALGTILIRRNEVRPIEDKHVSLLQTFADQAALAIENARLFTETKEALERQTATSEILRVIASSPSDVQPVFDAIVESAARLFGRSARLRLVGANGLHLRACSGPAGRPMPDLPVPIAHDNIGGQAVLGKRAVQIPDTEVAGVPAGNVARGYRAIAVTPLVREGNVLGGLAVTSLEPGALSEKQMELLQTFADQAVIAIENVRLFNETQEALARQEAASQVLRSISESVSDTAPVFAAILDCCNRLIPSIDYVQVQLIEGSDRVRLVDHLFGQVRGAAPGKQDERRAELMAREAAHFPRPLAGSTLERALNQGRVVILADTLDGPDTPPGTLVEARRWGHSYSQITVPLMREGRCIGAIEAFRRQLGGFEPKESSLLESFADQAVIAIENVRLFNETKESLERQTATAEILNVIASSPSAVRPVFDAIAASARRLLGGHAALVARRAGDVLELAAFTSTGEAGDSEMGRLWPSKITGKGHMGQALLSAAPAWVEDIETDPNYSDEFRAGARARGMRSAVSVPMLRDGEAIGVISVNRSGPGRFSDHQTNLLRTFADQAVIAIENVRLFNETKESLERQTATAEILKVIAGSPSDVQPVLEAVASSAARLCEANDVVIVLKEGDNLRYVVHHGDIPTGAPLGEVKRISADWTTGRAALESRQIYIRDVLDETEGLGEGARMGTHAGYRTVLATPLLREGAVLGVITMRRHEVQPFEPRQIELVNTFSDQAVIAIENVRLFNETKEALERQTATAEILQVIGSSPTDTQPVFDAIVNSGVRLFPGAMITVARPDGGNVRAAAIAHQDATMVAGWTERFTTPLSRDRLHAAAILDARLIDFPDAEAEKDGPLGPGVRNFLLSGNRAVTIMPMLRGEGAIGAISVTRAVPGPLSDKQIDILRTFADQAVIAIENVRLFKELEQRTEALAKSVGQLTALGEVGQAISSTLDLETVLKTIATHAVRLTGLDGASIYEYNEGSEEFRLQVADNFPQEFLQAIRSAPIRKGDGTVGKVAVTLEPIQVPDILDESYRSSRKELLVAVGYRAILTVPLLREGRVIGALNVTRKAPGPFADEIVELMKTFATQSAMAIQNARLFREIEEKGKQLEEASRHKSQFLASMSHELRTPLNAILGFNEMILGDIYGEVPADMKEPLTDIQTSGKHLLRLINNVLDLAKIEAGRMELAVDEYSVHDTVEGVRSTLRPLAEAKGLELAVDVPADIPLARGDGGRITQCLMNLAGNSLKFTKQGRVGISVALSNGTLTYKVQDTGIGIPADKIGSLFTEFKQTDATIASEYGGTGLGLSITKKFIEMHGGRIWAESEPGSGSTFIFEIPLRTGEARQE